MSRVERKKKLDRQHALPISRQCSALDISRSSAYRKPAGVNDEDVDQMQRLDALHLIFEHRLQNVPNKMHAIIKATDYHVESFPNDIFTVLYKERGT